MKSNYQQPTTTTVQLHAGTSLLGTSPDGNGITATQSGYTNHASDGDDNDGFSQE